MCKTRSSDFLGRDDFTFDCNDEEDNDNYENEGIVEGDNFVWFHSFGKGSCNGHKY